MVCSVMSEVFVTSPNGQLRYFASAIVADICSSGLALLMDIPPNGHSTLNVRNTYFHAVMYVRNTTTLECGVRIGCEFVHRLEWEPERMRTVRADCAGDARRSTHRFRLGGGNAGHLDSIRFKLFCSTFRSVVRRYTGPSALSDGDCAPPLSLARR